MFALILALGCPKGGSKAGAPYVGVWQDEGGALTTIEMVDRQPLVTSIVDYDGEVFQMEWTTFQAGQLSWQYTVPSTAYLVTIQATSIEGERMCTTWSNAYDAGEECYTRID